MASQRETWDTVAQDREPEGGKPAVCQRCDDLIQSIDGLHAAILQLTEILKGLGQVPQSRYRIDMQTAEDMLGESSMARRLGITGRVLARHRKGGKLPGCWVRNGRQIRWHVHETLEAWNRGVA